MTTKTIKTILNASETVQTIYKPAKNIHLVPLEITRRAWKCPLDLANNVALQRIERVLHSTALSKTYTATKNDVDYVHASRMVTFRQLLHFKNLDSQIRKSER